MNFEEIKQYLQENKENDEVKSYLQGLVSVEGVEKFVQSNKEGKSWLDSLVDKRSSKSLETWKSNNLEKLIDEEIKKRYPQKDEKDLEVEKLKAEVELMKQEKLREVLTNKAIKIANDKNLPLTLVDFFIGADEESTTKNLQVLEETFGTQVQKVVERRLKGEGYTPPKDGAGNTLTINAIQNMTPDEINKNWESIKQVLQNRK